MKNRHQVQIKDRLLFAYEKRILCFKLMYGTKELNPKMKKLMSYSAIAKILNMSVSSVVLALNSYADSVNQLQERVYHPKSKLRDNHIQFLISQEILDLWADKTLAERCVLFHRKFPEIKISPSTLSLLYRRNGIRKKVIILGKELRPWQKDKFSALYLMMKSEIKEAI